MNNDYSLPFFCCYLLTSLDARYTNHTYIGFTPHPKRRIRQHNGEIANGARRTSTKRPWEMVLIVHGFTSKKQALSFEFQWQRPTDSKSMRDVVSRLKLRGQYSLSTKIRYLFEMLQFEPWSRLPLHVQFLHAKYFYPTPMASGRTRDLLKGCPRLSPHMTCTLSPLDSLPIYSSGYSHLSDQEDGYDTDDSDSDDSDDSAGYSDHNNDEIIPTSSAIVVSSSSSSATILCGVCSESITPQDTTVTCPHSSCRSISHIQCLGSWFLKGNPVALLPTIGDCPSCNQRHTWLACLKRNRHPV